MPVISALRKLRQEACHEFKAKLGLPSKAWASLDYTVRPCLKKRGEKEANELFFKQQNSEVLTWRHNMEISPSVRLGEQSDIVTGPWASPACLDLIREQE